MASRFDSEKAAPPAASNRREQLWRWASVVHRNGWGTAAWGFALTLVQLVFVFFLSYERSFATTYVKLYRSDSVWYESIAREGYHSAVPPGPNDTTQDNVAFFPGFPLLARIVMDVSGLPSQVAIVLTSQLACWGFWTYLLLYLRRLQISLVAALAAIALIVAHPCTFYLVAGYSESLFLMTLLGYLYWSEGDDIKSWCLAAMHGFVMTATRIVGLPVAFAPVLLAFRSQKNDASLITRRFDLQVAARRLLLAGVTCMGAGLFFLYCQSKFGHWDLYLQTQRSGWGLVPDYLAIFRPEIYRLFLPTVNKNGYWDPNEMSRLAVPLTAALFGVFLAREVWLAWTRPADGWRRAPWYFAAWWMFYISVCGLVAVKMQSMIRYVLPIHIMFVLAGAHLFTLRPLRGLYRDVGFMMLAVALLHFVWLQATLAYNFSLGHWVA